MPARLTSALIWFLVAPLFGSIASCSNDGDSGSDGGNGSATSSGGSGIGGGTAAAPSGANTGGSPATAPSGTGTGGSGLGVSSGGSAAGNGGPAVASGGSGVGGDASSSVGSGGAPPAAGGATTGLATGGTFGATGGAESPAPGSGGAVGGAGSTLATGGDSSSASGGSETSEAGGSVGTAGGTGLGGTAPAGDTGGQPGGSPDGLPSLIGAVTFSVPSQTFQGQLVVGLSTSNASAEIHYTTSGLLPTIDDPLYAGAPLGLTATTQLRAQAFVAGLPAGQPSTAIYILRDFDYTSDIPIVVMEGYGGGKPPNKEDWLDLAFMTFEPTNGVADLASLPTLATRAGYHLRGQSSANFPKAPYRVELWDNDGSDEDYPVLGMPEESDWAMIGPCADNSLLRNAFIYDLAADLGLATMRLRFAEVFINQDDSPLEEADYEGVYAVTETVKNQKNRLDLKQLKPEDTTLPDITGGYIFKFDQAAVEEGEVELVCTPAEGSEDPEEPQDGTGGRSGFGFGLGGTMVDGCWDDLELVDPDPANAEQTAWITAHIQTIHDLMRTEPLGDYQSMINVASFVDNMIINEITRNVDAYIRSHYLHKDRDGLLTAGPVWDYNFSLGEVGTDLEGWQWEEGRAGPTDWHTVMATDPAFWAQVVARWQELRPGILSDEQLLARVDALSAPLVNAGPRDNARWPVGECFNWAMGGTDSTFVGDGTWEGEVQVLKDWLLARMEWLDGQLLTASAPPAP